MDRALPDRSDHIAEDRTHGDGHPAGGVVEDGAPQAMALAGPGLAADPGGLARRGLRRGHRPGVPRGRAADVQPGAGRRPTGWPSPATRSTGSSSTWPRRAWSWRPGAWPPGATAGSGRRDSPSPWRGSGTARPPGRPSTAGMGWAGGRSSIASAPCPLRVALLAAAIAAGRGRGGSCLVRRRVARDLQCDDLRRRPRQAGLAGSGSPR